MAKDLYVQDTAKVFFKSLTTGNIVGVGYAQTATIEATAEETPIKGGIGNATAYIIKSSKEINLTITSATFKPEFFALQQGSEYKNDVIENVIDNLFAKVEDDGTGNKVINLPEELKNLTTVRVEDIDGIQYDLPAIDGVVSVETFKAKDGDELEVFYLKEIKGRAITIDASKYPSKYRVEMQTLCYDRETETPYSDIYFIFPEASPSSAFTMSLTNGEALIPEIQFTVTARKGTTELGTKYEVLRKS